MRKPNVSSLVVLAILLLVGAGTCAHATDTVYYYYTDSLHSAVVETDAQGKVLERTHYAPYGQVLNRSLRDGPGYTGHEEDAATGLVYMQQRYYDPETGTFLSADPVQADAKGGSFNRYWYAKDNPYRYTDPDGRQVVVVVGACAASPPCAAAAVTAVVALGVAAKKAGDAAANYYDHVMQAQQNEAKDGSDQAGGKVQDINGKRPFTGEPGSTVRGSDGSRTYGKDGYPQTDRDRPHPSEKGKQGGEDHSHDWGRPPGGGAPRNENRGPSRPPKPSDPPPPRKPPPPPPREEH